MTARGLVERGSRQQLIECGIALACVAGEGLDLESMFSAFASFGAGKQGSNEMDRSRFVKLCKVIPSDRQELLWSDCYLTAT